MDQGQGCCSSSQTSGKQVNTPVTVSQIASCTLTCPYSYSAFPASYVFPVLTAYCSHLKDLADTYQPHKTTSSVMTAEKAHTMASYSQIACVGTGLSAIALGATLKRWYDLDDIRFFERENDCGGTWHVNSYPGLCLLLPLLPSCSLVSP